MTLTVNAWVAWAVAALALFGACTILYLVSGVLERLEDWWRDRREPPGEEDEGFRDGVVDGDTEALLPLPPVRSAMELGFTGPQPGAHWSSGRCWCDQFHRDQVETIALTERAPGVLSHLDVGRERWAPAWEAEARSAYQALDLDYPSGLLARIREQA